VVVVLVIPMDDQDRLPSPRGMLLVGGSSTTFPLAYFFPFSPLSFLTNRKIIQNASFVFNYLVS